MNEFSKNINKLSYDEIIGLLEEKKNDDLADLLDHKVRKIGDSAFSLLGKRKALDFLTKRCSKRLPRTKLGKIRVLNFMAMFKFETETCVEVAKILAKDSNLEVAEGALSFLLKYRMDQCDILQEELSDLEIGPELIARFRRAVKSRNEREFWKGAL